MTSHRNVRSSAISICLLAWSSSPVFAIGQNQFADVTGQAMPDYLDTGAPYVGESYSASWGDVNGDGWLDLFVSHHRNTPSLYVNMADGTFEDRWFEVDIWRDLPELDQHGAAWSDFDNDGDQDLFVSLGATDASQFLVHNGQVLEDRTGASNCTNCEPQNYNFDTTGWSGRMPLWFDYTQDGYLDFVLSNRGGNAPLFAQVPAQPPAARFVRDNFFSRIQCYNNPYMHLADFNDDGLVDLVCADHTFFPEHVYDFHSLPFVNLNPGPDPTVPCWNYGWDSCPQPAPTPSDYPISPPIGPMVDSLVADFDGDQDIDALVIEGRRRVSGAELDPDPSKQNRVAHAHVTTDNTREVTLTFRSAGDLNIELHWNIRNAADVFIGAAGRNPDSQSGDLPGIVEPLFIDACDDVPNTDPNDFCTGRPADMGIVPHSPEVTTADPIRLDEPDRGIYIGYEPTTQTWTIQVNPVGRLSDTYFVINSTAAISNLVAANLSAADRDIPPKLLLNNGGVLQEAADPGEIDDAGFCVSGVAGDFDNDKDIDIYLLCRGSVSNLPNRVYENNGSGVFTLVTNTGAEGPNAADDPAVFGKGLADTAAMGDYDADGFLDLYIMNGLLLYPDDYWGFNGPDLLLKNRGNGNNWIQIDLEGVTANRDAVGARVFATSGGVRQIREQNGGYHRYIQDQQRLHFGLGSDRSVDLEVHWPSPSTRIDRFTGLAVNRIYRIVEGNSPRAVSLPTSVPPTPCHEPQFDREHVSGVFLWQDCNTGIWSMRAVSGDDNDAFNIYEGSVLSDRILIDLDPATDARVAAFNIESSDLLDSVTDPSAVAFGLRVSDPFIDGFDFQPAEDARTCFIVDAPTDTQVFLGSLKAPVSTPLDLETLGPCGALPPSISVADVTVDEAAGTAVFTVSLSRQPGASSVSVDVATANGTAQAPADYTAIASRTLTFTGIQTSRAVGVPIEDDAIAESDETFTLSLTNPGNAVLADRTASATIRDNDSNGGFPSLFNLSTRARVRADEGTLIGGFVVRGDGTKRVLIRARGPSLADAGVSGAMPDPTLTLFSGRTPIGNNDNWRTGGQRPEIEGTGRAPTYEREAALIAELPNGPYTVHVQAATGPLGVAIFEVIGIDDESDISLYNVSTRASVEGGDDVAIGGFVIKGDEPKRVLIRARGPSMSVLPLRTVLADPTVELYSGSSQIARNDDWRRSPDADAIASTGHAPAHAAESALLKTLDPGPYTAIVRGARGGTGIGIIEVIAVDER